MADEDEIDILGDFSFNSCLAQNNQGIPSCSSREDTVHPQWLEDSTGTTVNWYDAQNADSSRRNSAPSRKLSGDPAVFKRNLILSNWSQSEKDKLVKEMEKYGRNIRKISQSIKTKTEAEIQALIEAEYGVHLDTPIFGLEKLDDLGDIPGVVQEEIVADEIIESCDNIPKPKKPLQRKNNLIKRHKKNLCRTYHNNSKISLKEPQIVYDDDIVIGSMESVGTDLYKESIQNHTDRMKKVKKIGNHRRKEYKMMERNKFTNKNDLMKMSPGRQKKDSLSEDNAKSPKMQLVFKSGQALPVSEGEEIIKLNKDTDPESDIDVDVDSDDGSSVKPEDSIVPTIAPQQLPIKETQIALSSRKFEPMPRRQKKINLDGGGGYTIMHTESGDLYEMASEPRRERPPKKQQIHLIQCRVYNTQKPAPFAVSLHVSALISMDAHAHCSRAEVMGLAGGCGAEGAELALRHYAPARAASSATHCDMDPVSQSQAAEYLQSLELSVSGWHHSHPTFPASPSAMDLRSQGMLQQSADKARKPFVGLITSQHWPTGRTASHYRCLRVESYDSESADTPTGYQLSVKLVPNLTAASLPGYLKELRDILLDGASSDEYAVDMVNDICPQAGITYLEKLISSISHHMHSAGYEDGDPVTTQLIKALRDIFR